MTQFTQPYLCGYKRSKAQCTYGGSQWRVLLNQSIVLRQVGAARTGSTARTETAFHECTRVWSTSFVALTIAKTTSVHITLCTDAEQSGNSNMERWHKELDLRKHVYLLMSLLKIFLRSKYCQRWVDTDSKEKCEPCKLIDAPEWILLSKAAFAHKTCSTHSPLLTMVLRLFSLSDLTMQVQYKWRRKTRMWCFEKEFRFACRFQCGSCWSLDAVLSRLRQGIGIKVWARFKLYPQWVEKEKTKFVLREITNREHRSTYNDTTLYPLLSLFEMAKLFYFCVHLIAILGYHVSAAIGFKWKKYNVMVWK